MCEYPINVNTTAYKDFVVQAHREVDECGQNMNWDELLERISSETSLANSCKLPVKNQQPTLYTPLHYAARGAAPKKVFKDLISMGAATCLKTADGLTAYDIAKSKGLDDDILKLLEIPEKIRQNAAQIAKMEKGLHSVIEGRVKDLIKKNGQALPQLAYLYEKGTFYYPVPGMYGGFNVFESGDGIQADSWIRICGGSEENHFIDREGNVKLLPNDNPI